MDGFTLSSLLQMVEAFGIPGMVFILWYVGERRNEKMLEALRKDSAAQLAAYREDTQAVAQMYRDNVALVQRYEKLSGDLTDMLVLSTRTMQQLHDAINTNQYCPYNRMSKQALGPQERRA